MILSRAGLLAAVAGGLVAVALIPGVGDDLRTLRGPDFPSALGALVSIAVATLGSWTFLAAVLACVPGVRGLAIALTPRVLRGLLFAGVSGALAFAPAHADVVPERDAPGPVASLDGLRLPERPVNVTGSLISSGDVVVQHGDTLWSIAARTLPADAGAAHVAAEVERWHAANLDVIGADPDLIRPRQRLTPPIKDQP